MMKKRNKRLIFFLVIVIAPFLFACASAPVGDECPVVTDTATKSVSADGPGFPDI